MCGVEGYWCFHDLSPRGIIRSKWELLSVIYPEIYLFFLQDMMENDAEEIDPDCWEEGFFPSIQRHKDSHRGTEVLNNFRTLGFHVIQAHSTWNTWKNCNTPLNLCKRSWWSLMEKRWHQKWLYFHCSIYKNVCSDSEITSLTGRGRQRAQ